MWIKIFFNKLQSRLSYSLVSKVLISVAQLFWKTVDVAKVLTSQLRWEHFFAPSTPFLRTIGMLSGRKSCRKYACLIWSRTRKCFWVAQLLYSSGKCLGCLATIFLFVYLMIMLRIQTTYSTCQYAKKILDLYSST